MGGRSACGRQSLDPTLLDPRMDGWTDGWAFPFPRRQVHFFTVQNSKLYGKLNWRIVEPDGEFFTRCVTSRTDGSHTACNTQDKRRRGWVGRVLSPRSHPQHFAYGWMAGCRNTVQRFVQDPEKPAILYNHDNEYLHYQARFFLHARIRSCTRVLSVGRLAPYAGHRVPITSAGPFSFRPPSLYSLNKRTTERTMDRAGRLVHPGLRAAAVHRRLLPRPQRRLGK